MLKERNKLSPIMTFIILIFTTIILSGFLYFINMRAEYSTVNTATNKIISNVVEVNNLFSFSGLKHIVTTAVNGFVNYAPLGALLIVLIGIGMLEKSGFLKTAFTCLTKHVKKNTVTFILIFISMIFSLVGDIGFVVMLPVGALLFKYGRRNPLGGIIASFAGLSFGYGINVLLSSNDSSLLSMTLNAVRTIDKGYAISEYYSLYFMIVALIILTYIFTVITEKRVMPKLGKYEPEVEETVITKKDLRGLIVAIGAGLLYLLLVIYMIIPNLPLSGALLDHNATRYIDMLFGSNSLFNKGFIFIVTLWFFVIGLAYGLMTKKFRSSKDITEGLSHSLDGIGSVIVLIFFASLFINVYEESNIGLVITAFISNLIGKLSFNGLGLIIISFMLIAVSNLFCPNSLTKWSMISAVMIPLFVNSSISPEYGQIVYNLGDSITNGIVPLMVYSVVFVAFMEKYNKSEEKITLFGCHKYMINYALAAFVIAFVLLAGWYLIGIPTGIGTFPGITYVS